MSEISELKNRLKANPIFALSLGSRELFHSNFLGWMFKNYPQMIAAVFDGPVAHVPDVLREKRNLDLVIEFGPEGDLQAIVIEIKVKDAPKLEQLKGYDGPIAKEYSSKDVRINKILLSLVEVPESVKTETTWTSLSFAKLGQNIKKLLPKSNIIAEHAIIVRLYAELCCDLAALVAKVNEADRQDRVYFFHRSGKKDANETIDKELKVVGFVDTLNKQRASALREEIERQAKSSGLQVKAGFGLDNKTPHAGASVVLELPGSAKLSLGVHIQGEQYRHVLDFDRFAVRSSKAGKNYEDMEAFIAATDGWKWMFAASHSNGKFDGPHAQEGFFMGTAEIPTRQQKGKLLCSYAPRHIYQYSTIGDAQAVPIDQVVEAVIADLHYATKLLSDPAYVERFVAWSGFVDGMDAPTYRHRNVPL